MRRFSILALSTMVAAIYPLAIDPNALRAEGRSGEQVYNTSCTTCHAIGVANAPKTNDSASWKARGKSVAEFVASSKKGINSMPPMGLCSDCTDGELKAAIEFMMAEKKE